jgi:Zn-dependent protease with chaperone function/phage gp36-like protein
MSMTQERFDELVGRLESSAKRSPGSYKLKLMTLAALGYIYIFGILVVLIAILIAMALSVLSGKFLVLKLFIPLFFLIYAIVQALQVEFPAPDGIEITSSDASKLFSLIEEIKEKIEGPNIDHILVTDEFNAAIVQIPRLGLLGWSRNYLIIGLPLMQALSVDQFKAVLAHELGHLSGSHGKFGSWIYRIRQTWVQIMSALEEEQRGSFLFKHFFSWYAPYFQAYSFVLARNHEYEADQYAAEVAGASNAADALISADIQASYLEEEFWPSLLKRAELENRPPNPYKDMQLAFSRRMVHPRQDEWMSQALLRQTSSTNTHPSLRDRLIALGQEPRVPSPPKETAEQFYLKNCLDRCVKELGELWIEKYASVWKERHKYAQESLKQLKSLDEKAELETLSITEAWQRASWTEEFFGEEQAIPKYHYVLSIDERHRPSHFSIGRILLSKNDASGIEMIKNVMDEDFEYVIPGCQIIYNYLMMNEREEDAQKYYKQAVEFSEIYELAKEERSNLGFKDSYINHNLSSKEEQELKNQLSHYPQITEAYLVRKEVTYIPTNPLYVLGVKLERDEEVETDKQFSELLAEELLFREAFLVFVINNRNKEMEKIMREVPGSRIYIRN